MRVLKFKVVEVKVDGLVLQITEQSHRGFGAFTIPKNRITMKSMNQPEWRFEGGSRFTFFARGSAESLDGKQFTVPYSHMKEFVQIINAWVKADPKSVVRKPAPCKIDGEIVTIKGKKYKLQAVK